VLKRDDLVAPSIQDRNAGNSGDLFKHSAYLALVRKLPGYAGRLNVVEAHGGKGVYISANRHLMAARELPSYGRSSLGLAQSALFDTAEGLGHVSGLLPGEVAYAGSTALHAQLVKRRTISSLTVFDHDAAVRAVANRIFSEENFSSVRSRLRIVDLPGGSETRILSGVRDGAFGPDHILHFDPFAFVMAQEHSATRTVYRDLVKECDTRVKNGTLAAASLFVTWGSNGAAAKDDLHGRGYLGGLTGGYRDLVASVDSSQRIVVRWCWELFFSMLFIVPSAFRTSIAAAIEHDISWLIPLVREVKVM
jgi:hypothetical protein